MKRLVVLAVMALVILGVQFLANCASPLEPTSSPNPIPPKPPDTIYDTLMLVEDHWDTTFDTTHLGDTIEYWDTVTIFDSLFFTDTVEVTDTLVDTLPCLDTTFITDTLIDTTMVYDTTAITDTLLDTFMVYDTTAITDTLLDTFMVYDTTAITDTLIDTFMVYDSTTIYDTTNVTDTLNWYDTVTVVDTIYADTVCPILECIELNSCHMSAVWMLHNTAGNYRLRFTGQYVYWDQSKPLIIDIDGTEYIWDPETDPELIIDRWLDDDAVITISQTPNKDASTHPIDICVSVTPVLLE